MELFLAQITDQGLIESINAVMNTVQVVALAYIAAMVQRQGPRS